MKRIIDQTAWQEVCNGIRCYKCSLSDGTGACRMGEYIHKQPVYEERPHGEWLTTPNPNHSPFDSTSEVIYMCSQCAYSSGERIVMTWQFCPNCGADMRKEGE